MTLQSSRGVCTRDVSILILELLFNDVSFVLLVCGRLEANIRSLYKLVGQCAYGYRFSFRSPPPPLSDSLLASPRIFHDRQQGASKYVCSVVDIPRCVFRWPYPSSSFCHFSIVLFYALLSRCVQNRVRSRRYNVLLSGLLSFVLHVFMYRCFFLCFLCCSGDKK